jgi:hypothetical protein
MRVLLACLTLALAALAAPALLAQTPPRLEAAPDVREALVGRPFGVTLDVSSESGSPAVTDPRLPVPQGLSVLGEPSISSSTQISITNFSMRKTSGMKIVWQVVASHEGTYAVGPPSVAWSGRRLSTSPLTITVRTTPSGVRSPAPGAMPSPFDPFGIFPPSGLLPSGPPQTDDPELQVERAPDPNVFLRAVASARSAVVGQQITLCVYQYARVDLAMAGMTVTDSHEPSTPGFYRKDMLPPNSLPDPQAVMIDGVAWAVRAVYRSALFPLSAGELTIGETRQTFVSRSFGGRSGVRRSAAPITIRVTEPPLAGRPPGYAIGDVGSFSLAATIEPRSLELGSAVAVTATVKGVGNPPAALRIPTQASLEWLEPQVRENIDVVDGKLSGTRTFTYIVRPKSAGTIDVGTLALPYWDPDRHTYEVARAVLGSVVVARGKGGPPKDDLSAQQDPFRAVAPLRTALGPAPAARTPLTDRPVYWLLLCGAPVAVVIGSGIARAAGAAAARLKVRRGSPERKIKGALAAARAAHAEGDVQKAAAALDRAVYTAIEHETGIRARSLLLDELPAKLDACGIAASVGAEIRDVLATLEQIRFTPGAKDALGGVLERTVRVLGDLSKRGSRRKGASAAVAVISLLVAIVPVRAAAQAPEAALQQAVHELQSGDFTDAIDRFEALADQGVVHPDASYDRGVAYVERIKAGAERPGDLGRAAAAFEETLLLRPSDRDADGARDAVRAEVARRRVAGGAGADVEARPTLDRALVGLAGETTWAVLALVASALLTIGLLLRAVGRAGGNVHLAGAVASPIGAILVVLFGALAFGARHTRKTTEDGVIVVTEARLSDERGILQGGLVPEAAKVEITDRRGGLLHVRWGTQDGWVSTGAVRRLARP